MVSAHATNSTPAGDGIEYMTITDKFGDIPIYAPKSKIGLFVNIECIIAQPQKNVKGRGIKL